VTWRFGASALDWSFTQSNELLLVDFGRSGALVRSNDFGRCGRLVVAWRKLRLASSGELGLIAISHSSSFDSMKQNGSGFGPCRAALRQRALRGISVSRGVPGMRRLRCGLDAESRSSNRFPLCQLTRTGTGASAPGKGRDAVFASAGAAVGQAHWKLRFVVVGVWRFGAAQSTPEILLQGRVPGNGSDLQE
jgi:hypothetical protein